MDDLEILEQLGWRYVGPVGDAPVALHGPDGSYAHGTAARYAMLALCADYRATKRKRGEPIPGTIQAWCLYSRHMDAGEKSLYFKTQPTQEDILKIIHLRNLNPRIQFCKPSKCYLLPMSNGSYRRVSVEYIRLLQP